MYEIRIKGVRNGLIVNVGCWELVFNSIPEFVAELSKYLTNPEAVGEEYVKKYAGKESYSGEMAQPRMPIQRYADADAVPTPERAWAINAQQQTRTIGGYAGEPIGR